MKLSPDHKVRIKEISRVLRCPHGRSCYAYGFETLGRVRPVGSSGILECLESRGRSCPHGLSFGRVIFCQCPLRKYLAENGLA